MTTKLQRRIFSLTAALAFFATAAADAYGLHACPHHDSLPAQATHEAPEADAHTDPATRASHTGHTDARPADAGEDHGPCTCVGACSASPATLPQPLTRFELATVPVPAAPAGYPEAQPRERLHPHVLPYANAPPLR